jgi:2-dehydropantoate 2-reductase
MKIGIIGAGAMGSVYAGLMADAGHEVWMFDSWAEHVAAVKANGLRVQGASGDRTVNPNATTDAKEAGECELAIVATKAMQTKEAVQAAGPMLGLKTAVLSLQNGLGNVERIQELVDPSNVLCGIAGGFGASMVGPGHVHHNGMEAINIAEAAGGISSRIELVADAWRESGFTVGVYEDIWPVVWSKLMANIAVSATCTLTGMRVGQVVKNEWAWGLSLDCVREAAACAQAKGIKLLYDDPIAWVHDFTTKIPDARPSMYLDTQAGRVSEIGSIHGGVVAEGKKLRIATPTCEFMVRAVTALQEKNRVFGPGNAYKAL